MNKFLKVVFIHAGLLWVVVPIAVGAPLKVVTTTPDLGSLVAIVGGDRVQVESLAKGYQDPHFVEAKPSLVIKLMKADLFIETGLELEAGWAPLLLQSSRNRRVQKGSPGYLDASAAVVPLDVPVNPTRAMGDVHPGGNPHYLLDPENGRRVAKLIADKLAELAPADAALFEANRRVFDKLMNDKIVYWKEQMRPLRGATYVSFHKNVAYFAHAFGLVSVGELEPKPGVPPTAGHTAELMARMKAQNTRLVLSQPWFEPRTPASVSRATGARVVTLALMPGTVPEVLDYPGVFDFNIRALQEALK